MMPTIRLIVIGIFLLCMGISGLRRYKESAKMMAEHDKKENASAKWFKQPESEEYWRAFNMFGGIVLIASGLLLLSMTITGGAAIPDHGVIYYLVSISGYAITGVFIFGVPIMIYYSWKFKVPRDKDKGYR